MQSDKRMAWIDAVYYCRDRDAILPSIHNSEENSYISDNVCTASVLSASPYQTLGCWIGLTYKEEDGVWLWLGGTYSSDYENWHYDEPNNLGKKENYAYMLDTGTWKALDSESNFWAICMRAVPTGNPISSPSDSPTMSISDSPSVSPSDSPILPPKEDPTASP